MSFWERLSYLSIVLIQCIEVCLLQTGIILAGGISTRMGFDKSMINSNVSRLANEMRNAGCESVKVMCGTIERAKLFDEDCLVDSKETLAESLLEVIAQIQGVIQLAPCDAYLADCELFESIDGVPVDDRGIRQPLLAKFDSSESLINSKKITEVFRNIPSCPGGIRARNVNTQEEFKEIEHLLKK